MASSSLIALRRSAAPSTQLLSKLLTPIRSASLAPSLSRTFNTNAAQLSRSEEDDDDRVSTRFRGRRSPAPFISDVFDPFSSTQSVSQLLNLMDHFVENPYLAGTGGGASGRRGWDVKEEGDALYLRMDMPGLGKEDVKVSVEENTMIIKGEGEEGRKYSSRIDLPPNLYKVEEIKAEMKNGVLKVGVPKVKEEERKEVHQIKIE